MARRLVYSTCMRQLVALFVCIASFTYSYGQNPIVTENAIAGTPKATWDISGAGDLSIQGFATDMSVNKGTTVSFKINAGAGTAYSITIYRLGYYQGNGARLITNLGNFTGTSQPNPTTNSTTGLIDCGNWAVSASWAVPATAVSGLYIAKLIKTSNGGASHIAFVVRDDASTADILLKTSDATWQAYNVYGGNSSYVGATSFPNGHAVKLSYNRPFITRNGGGGGSAMEDWFMNAEYPMIRFLERNGYNIAYTTDVDMDRDATIITPAKHKIIISSGHDEYWSGAERTKFENARNAGVHLAFFSGNEVYWKTRWEDNRRTLVCYKEGTVGENVCGSKCDPSAEWTGLWREGCAFPGGGACKPENALTGQISWSDQTSAIRVPAAFKDLRFWRNTSVAALATGGTAVFPTGTLGYEWDFEQFPASNPHGRITLSSTVFNGKEHRLSLYRHSSGALVFGAGTVQWAWGLDNIHDRGSAAASLPMQQATVNLFADMGVQPASIMAGLTAATASTDVAAPVVTITTPTNGATFPINTAATISGTASDANGFLVGVQISVDGGTTWQNVTGTTTWSFSWTPTVAGAASIRVRGFDDSGNMGVPGVSGSSSNINVTIGGTAPSCPCSIFAPTSTPAIALDADGQGIEVGLKFRATQNGFITGIRFYKGAGNTGTHVGHLWSSTGTQLGEATFIGETASGWQQVLFSAPIAITANTTYVASYFSPNGFYSSTNPYFTAATVNGNLRALANGEDGANGIYIYSATSAFPTNNFQSTNYWVDVVYTTNVAPDGTAPTVSLTAPAAGTITGVVNVTANASDNVGVAGVQFLLNGANLGTEDVAAPYAFSWNTTTVANGSYTLTARARDGAGNTTTSSSVVVNVNNIPDTQAPTVSLATPAAGNISGTVNVSANAIDNIAVAGVQFLLNGANLGAEDVSSPFAYAWNTFPVANGTYTLTARARDAAGNTTTSAGVIITINNTSNLTLAQPMDEGTGTLAVDITGNAHNGTLTNGPTWGAGNYGQGINLDGTNDFVNIADHNNFTLDPAQSYTWSGWVKNTNFREWSTLWSQTLDGNNFFYFYTHTTADPDGGPVTNGISVYWWGSGGTNKLGAHSNNNVLTAGTWSYIAITYDASQPQNNRFTIYVNGVDVTVRGDVSSTGTLPIINPTNVRIGANQPWGEYFTGSVDEFRYYRRLLSAAEVQSDMNTPLAPDVTNPVVSLTAPAAGTVSGTVNVNATATDNVNVAGVQFLLNGANLGAEDLVAPYTVPWNTTTAGNGNHTLTARARDAAGNNTTSTGVVVTVSNIPDVTAPTVSITAPAAGNISATINVDANASDNIGVVGVQFLLNGANLGTEDITAPYSVSWNTLTTANGNYTLTARARDAAGNITVSTGVAVNVNNDTQAPTVSLTAPAAGNVSGNVNVNANAADNFGVVGVQFLLNGANLGAEDLVAPYSTTWNTTIIANGNYTLTARARDAAGNITTSTAVAVTVNNIDAIAPTVSITAPSAGTVSGNLNVTANASDNISVTGVQFKLSGANLGAEDLTAPYSVSWDSRTVANGSYTLTATARDGSGNITTSAGVVVLVDNDFTSPTVSLTSPAAGNASGTVNVSANATDNLAVAGVQFLLNGANLGGEDVSAPFAYSWNTFTVTNGTYTLSARARDAAGNVTTSAGVVVTVANTIILAQHMDDGTGTLAADVSGNAHNGALTNGPTWGAGKYGQGINLDGADDFVNIADHNNFSLDPAQSYTWSGWIRNTNFREWSTLWSQTVDGNNFFYFYTHTSTDPDGGPVTNGISVYWWGSGGTNKLGMHSNNNVLTAGVWSYLAITYDASQPQNNRFTIYVNGVDVTARGDVSSTGTLPTLNPTNIRIGSNQPFGEYYTGSIDEFRFYRRLLSGAEVQSDMNTPLTPDVTNPVVSITAPAAGTISGTVNVNATATDNVSVAGVQFLLNGANLGAEDLVAPYTVPWNTTSVPNGNYTLTAYARDVAGNTATSTGVVVTLNNIPDVTAPTVSITAPVAGNVSGTINVDANAADNIGVIGVQFLLNGANLGTEDVTAPYSVSWNTLTTANGNYTLTARARDGAGNITVSTGVVLNVNNDTQAPTVSLTAPAAGNVSGNVNVDANAADNFGVVGVQFLLNGANLGAEDLVAPYSTTWNTTIIANGNYSLTARARDATGNITTSTAVAVTVNNIDATPPTVSITAPVAGTILGTLNITANASDNISVTGVQFQLNGANLGAEDLTAPYSVSWDSRTVANGTYTLTAIARDGSGNITTSAGVIVLADNDFIVPTVAMTAPAAGNVTGTFDLSANASDNVGVVGVQFQLNGANVGAEDVTAPYSVSWNSTTVLNGTFTLNAVARDAAGNTTTSSGVTVTVFNNTMLIAALNFNEGLGTAAADMSGNGHNGTLTNGTTWVAGKNGQGVNGDGTNDYVNIADHANFTLEPTQNYTWSTWLKTNNFNEWSTVWSQTVNSSNFFYMYAHTSTDPDGGPVTNGLSVYWWNNDGSSKIGVHTSNNVLTVGTWSHVTVTYNSAQPQNNRFTIYVNGVDVTVRTDVSSVGTISTINPSNIRIASNQPFGEYLNGAVDDVRFYRRLLTPAEVQTDMNTPIASRLMPTVSPVAGATNVNPASAVTAVFNLQMDATTINGSTIELRNAANVLLPATVTYNATTRTATLTPTPAMANSALYSAKIKGGPSGVKDATGLIMAGDYTWSFTTADPALLAPSEGPGGPILVVSSSTNPYSRYAVEILRAEGLNHFAAADISAVTATMLNNYDVVVLGELTVTAAQVTLLTNWVNAGGTLIAFKPSSLLTPLLGISTASGTLADRYLLINTTSGPGVGIVNQTMQYHGSANLHTLSGATSLATLYSAAATATTNPAVTTRSVGSNGGVAVAFTYDLARSIVYTRQGNPAWSGLKRDGTSGPIRSDDLFFPDWIDFNKVAIPQADEQQRLLANIILQNNLHRKPLPRFWYLPRDLKAAIVMTGDDHSNNGTTGRFNQYLTLGPNTAQDVADWNAVRATSYILPGTNITDAQAANFDAQGFEIALHVNTTCLNFTQASLNTAFDTQLEQMANTYPSLPPSVTGRTHCLVWSDWATGPKVELANNIRLDANYYYWPAAWVLNRPGMFTGSGIPMRFADLDGTLIDNYQLTTQMTDESGIGVANFTNQLLDKALGSQGYYGVFTANMHTDTANHIGSNAIIASAQARQVPIISARQMLNWLDGRNNSFFNNMTWSNNQLSFNILTRSGARNLKAMLPLYSETGQLISVTMNGNPVAFTTQTIKGIEYAFFLAAIGNNSYVADYGGSLLRVGGNDADVTAGATESKEPVIAEVVADKLEVIVMPNPSSTYFTLVITSKETAPVSIKIVNVFGQTAEKYDRSGVGTLNVGHTLAAGTYFAEVTQGDQRKVLKIVKIN
ncbi:MAG: DUF4082 domain-containing protein [Chitinophagaceae bacterium]|nr:DUF4082 domain-containing protein [Chitinophagaceae bacterium]